MLNLIKMDLYRLFRTKSFWVMIIVTALVAVLNSVLSVSLWNSVDSSVSVGSNEIVSVGITNASYDEEMAEDSLFGEDIMSELDAAVSAWGGEKIYFADTMNLDISSLNLLIFCAIFPALFVNAEQKYGFIKNIAGQLPNRGMLVLSKLPALAVQVIIMFATYMLTCGIVYAISISDRIVFDMSAEFIKITLLHLLLHFAFAVLMAAITILLRGSALSMTFGIIISSGFTAIAYSIVNLLLEKIGFSDDFDIGIFAIESCIKNVSTDIAGGDLARTIIVGVAFFAISLVVSMLAIQKRDVK